VTVRDRGRLGPDPHRARRDRRLAGPAPRGAVTHSGFIMGGPPPPWGRRLSPSGGGAPVGRRACATAGMRRPPRGRSWPGPPRARGDGRLAGPAPRGAVTPSGFVTGGPPPLWRRLVSPSGGDAPVGRRTCATAGIRRPRR